MRHLPQPALYRIKPASCSPSCIEPLLQQLNHPPVTQKQAATHQVLTLFDTFEWNAWQKNNAVIKTGRRLCVLDLKTGTEIACCDFRKNPAFFLPEAIGDPKMALLLSGFSSLRAWLRLCAIERHVETFKVFDENQKTIATLSSHLYLHNTSDGHSPRAGRNIIDAVFSITPLRGYEENIRRLADEIAAMHANMARISFSDIYRRILESANLKPGSYSSKPKVQLDSNNTIFESSRLQLLETLEVLTINEPWLTKNADTEFLHDYRVGIRRSRSILAQLKGVFPPQQLRHFRQELRTLAKRTNNLRDQDVYLLEADAFRDLLPGHLRPHLEQFFNDLRSARKNELRSFSRYLQSSRHQELMESWGRFLKTSTAPDISEAPNCRQPTASVALLTIKKAWKKVLRHGRSISPEATDTELHSLRIDCKKLRYLLEFFSSIFPPKTIGPVIRHLKKLQDNLGKFVDLSVQQDYLNTYLADLEQKPHTIGIAAAIGGLVTTLHHERELVRDRFHDTFMHFDSSECEALFSELFHQYRNS